MKDYVNPFELVGFHLEEIQMKRSGNEYPENIEIKIESVDNLEDMKIINMTYRMKIKYENSGISTILYRAVFKMNENFAEETKVMYDLDDLSPKQFSLLSSLSAFVFPYFRQNLNSLTNDSGFTINLPLLDARNLIKGIKLNYSEDSEGM